VRYKVISRAGQDIAREFLRERKRMPDLAAHEVVVGVGDALDDSVLSALASKIRKVQTELAKAKQPAEELDRRCFDLVHEALNVDDPLLISDMGFWSRFAILELTDVIYSRFPGRKGQINLDNFGLGSRKECWPYKLWVRGQLAFDPTAKDKYTVGRLAGVDVWTSHVHRQNFMSIRTIFRGVFRFQYPKELKGKPLLFEGEEEPEKGGVPGLRTLIKRLRENWASVEYSFLSESEAADLVRLHGRGLCRADDKSVLAET
jgi:hypothetical protein